MRVPAFYRKSETHRSLWATMKFLAEADTVCPILKGEYDREVVKAAVDRRRTILEHEAADGLADYFREERLHVAHAIDSSEGKDVEKWIGMAIGSLNPDLEEVIEKSWRTSVEQWGSWAERASLPQRKYAADQPRDDEGKWTAGGGTSKFSPLMHEIRSVLSPDLLHPDYRSAGAKSPDPNCAGHCYAAAEALYHMGAKGAGFKPYSIRHENSVHWFLKNPDDETILDPTATQFHKPVPYDKGVGRGFLTKQPSKRAATIMARVRGNVKKAKVSGTDAWLKRNLASAVKGITETTRKRLAAMLVEGEKKGLTLAQQAKRIDKLYLDEIIPNRSMTIARTEVGRATNWTQQTLAEDSDVPLEKEWLALDDDRTRDTHADADGQRVGLDDLFQVGDNELLYPGDPSGDPEEVINCRCSMLHHVVDEAPRHKSVSGIYTGKGDSAENPPVYIPSPAEFAKSVTGIENPDVITALAFAKGVFGDGDEWTRSRDILMKHVYRIRRYSADQPRDEEGKWTDTGAHQPIHFDFDKGGWTTHDGAPVYHGTTDKAIKQILKEGLLASKAGTIWESFSKKGYTYLGDDENVAAQWAHDAIRQERKNWRLRNDASEPEPRHKAALIEIVVPKDYLDKLEPDRHFRLDSDTARTLQFKGDIKPEWITHAWVMTQAGSDRTVGPKDAPDAWKQIKSEHVRMIACVLLPEPDSTSREN